MRILNTLTYYTPHISGLTIYARRLVRRLAAGGHRITVLTSHYDHGLPAREEMDGATVVRSPVLARISKGALMPFFPWQAARLVAAHDLVHLHLPQFEASAVAVLAKALGRPVVVSYQCDLVLPSRRARLVFSRPIAVSHRLTLALADRIVATSDDFAASSPLLGRFSHKVLSVHPPIELAEAGGDCSDLRERHGLGQGPLVGFVGRFAAEKGIDYLLESVPLVRRQMPDVRFVLAGQTEKVVGERVHRRLNRMLQAAGHPVVHLGVLDDADLAGFYRLIDVLVLPSINSTESFGMTQAEAMLAGTPVVASDLPGVREAVRATGMGELVAPRDAAALAGAIVSLLRDPARYLRPEREVRERFDPQATARFYESLYSDLLRSRGRHVAAGEASEAVATPEEAGSTRSRGP